VITPIVVALLPLTAETESWIDMVRWSAAIFVITFGISIIYRYGPRKRDGKRAPWLTPGALFSVVMWAVASAAFSEYLANFGRYNEVYGSIGAVVALLMWLYFSAFLVLLGGALNAQIERHRGISSCSRRSCWWPSMAASAGPPNMRIARPRRSPCRSAISKRRSACASLCAPPNASR